MCVPCRSVQPNARSGRRPRAARLFGHCDRCKVGAAAVPKGTKVRCGAVWLGVVYVDAVQIEHASAWCTCTRIPKQLWCLAASGVCWYTHHSAEEDHVDRNLRFRKPFQSTERESCGGAAAPCDRIRQLKEDGPGPARPGFSSCKLAVAIHRREARHGRQRRCVQEILPHIQRLPYDVGGML